ncbi:acetate/propionate family kinase [Candidatus Woesearchaeota archaeon]|nr:acetate/propionate family kinase [Candidatus Woesearchaeota archaeon]
MKVLVFNAGSSSLKFALYEMPSEQLLMSGFIEAIGLKRSRFETRVLTSKGFNIESFKLRVKNMDEAVSIVLRFIKTERFGFDVIAHRVVHDCGLFGKPVFASEKVLEKLEGCSKLAPLHNPVNLAVVKACNHFIKEHDIKVRQVLCFDTCFFKQLPLHEKLYALPLSIQKRFNIQRFGFHGLSHAFVSSVVFKNIGKGKIVTCHLGGGSSVAAVVNKKCVATSMGFTPLEGLVMGTRPGNLDPGVVLFLIEKFGLEKTRQLLNYDSGLKGVTGFSDMRDVLEILDDKTLQGTKARLGFEMFTSRVAFYIAGFAALMNGLNAIAFTAGIGENEARTRKAICEKLGFLGVKIDQRLNKKNAFIISKPDSKVKVFVVKDNEALHMARLAFKLVRKKS